MKKESPGFTLIELLISVAIVAILMAIAIPSYRAYVFRSYLSEAFDGLSNYQIRMEQALSDNGNYGVGACAVATTNTVHFTMNCALTNGGLGFTATATANNVGGFTGYTYTINEQSARTTTVFPNGVGLPSACWLVHVGDC